MAAGAKLGATACVSGSLDATVVTIGDGAILATMIQSDAADYFGTVDNGRQALLVPDVGTGKLNQILLDQRARLTAMPPLAVWVWFIWPAAP